MKPNPNTNDSVNRLWQRTLWAAALVSCLAAGNVSGADAAWTNNASSTWATATNWDTGAVPGATTGTTSTDTAYFYTTPLTAARAVTVDAGRNVQNILFTNSTTGFTFQLTGGSLLLSSGGRIELQGAATANIQTFVNTPLWLQGNYSILNNGGNTAPTVNNLEFQSGSSMAGSNNLGSVTLTFGGTNGNNSGKGLVSGIVSNGVGNTLTVVKQDSGTWQFNGANTFTGGFLLKQGAVIVGNANGLGATAGTVTVGDNATGQDVQIITGSSITVVNPLNVASGLGARILSHLGGSGNGAYSGLVTLNKDVMLRNFSGNSTRTLTFSGGFAGTGSIIITNGGAGVGNTAVISGAVTNVGSLINVSVLGDATVSGAIGTNSTGVVQNSATSILNLNAANTYTAGTTISAGTLKLGAAGSIAGSTNIAVSAGAVFDVSAVTGGFTLANGQTLRGGGNVNGSLTAAAGSKISPADAGVAGTLTFNNNLLMGSGTNLVLDVSTASGSGNDLVSVSGTLTAGGVISLSALSGAANLDTNADYVIASASSISGSFASTPVWIGTAPANAANFSVVTSPTQVTLHFNPSVPPIVTAVASPSSVVRGQTFKVTANVTPGSIAPGSAISTVTIDLSFIGGSSSTSLVLSNNNVWTNSFTVPNGSSLGSTVLAVTATDASALQGTFGIPFTVSVANETWNGAGANNDWGTPANWTNNFAPLLGDLVFFDGSTRTSPNLESSYNVAAVTFNSGAASFNVGTGNGSTLTIGSGLTNNSANAQTVSAPIASGAGDLLPISAAAGDLVLSGSISDSGAGIFKAGSGALTLSAANTYSGATVVGNGTLNLTGSGTLGAGSSPLTNAATINLGGTTQNVGVAVLTAGSVSNGTLTATDFQLQGGTVSASLAGTGVSATKSTTNTLVLTGNNTFDNGFVILNTSAGLCVNSATAFGTGTINISSGNGGSFDCTAASAVSNANNNAILISGNFTFVGSQNLNLGAGTANMGSAFDKDINVQSNALEFAGNIFSGGTRTLSKSGNGKLVLSGASTYFGPTAVNGGTLTVNGSLDANGAAVTVANGATLGGNGTISRALIINAGGTLSPGNSVGVLTVNSNLTLSGNLFIEVDKALTATNDSVVVSGVLTNAGTGTLTITNLNLAQPFVAGDSFKLFSQPLLNGSALTLVPATPGTGLAWNNKLALDGTVAVVAGVATNPTNLTFSVGGGNLNLTWPADHTGWTLQAQTNGLSVGLGTNWFNVPGSSATNEMSFPAGTATGAVFFRLVYP